MQGLIRSQLQCPILQVALLEAATSSIREQFTLYSLETSKLNLLFRIHGQRSKREASFKANQSYLSVIAPGFPEPTNVTGRKLSTLSLRIKGAQNITPKYKITLRKNKTADYKLFDVNTEDKNRHNIDLITCTRRVYILYSIGTKFK